jgi:hypothetical protein
MPVGGSWLTTGAKAPFAKVASSRGAKASEMVCLPYDSGGIGGKEMCDLLLERLQDVSLIYAVFGGSFGHYYCYNSFASSVQALSLTKAAEKIIMDESGDSLRKRTSELNEENSCLKMSNVELENVIGSSTEAITVLQKRLDAGI